MGLLNSSPISSMFSAVSSEEEGKDDFLSMKNMSSVVGNQQKVNGSQNGDMMKKYSKNQSKIQDISVQAPEVQEAPLMDAGDDGSNAKAERSSRFARFYQQQSRQQ